MNIETKFNIIIIKIALNGFLCVFKTLAYANKSNSKEGNKPNAIFNTIAITATA